MTSMIYNITLYIICFNVGVNIINLSTVFEVDGVTLNAPIQANVGIGQQINERVNALNSSSYFQNPVLSNTLQPLIQFGDFIRATFEMVGLFSLGLFLPGQILIKLWPDPPLAWIQITTGMNVIIGFVYFIAFVQFIANRSLKSQA